jgi:hypothetical protein
MPDVRKRRTPPAQRHHSKPLRLRPPPPTKNTKSGPTAVYGFFCSPTATIPPSEASTIDCELGPGDKTLHDDVLWTFDHIKCIKGDRCQVSWADSILSGKQLSHGVLHGKGLREHAERIEAQRGGLFQVAWHPTWEPVKDWTDHLHDMSHDSRFQRRSETGVVNGFVAQYYPSCIVHQSLLDSTFLGSRLLIDEMASCTPAHLDRDSDGGGDGNSGFLYITWRLHWSKPIESV